MLLASVAYRRQGFQHRTDASWLTPITRPQSTQGASRESPSLLGGCEPTSGPLSAATGLGLAGFFLPLFKPMLGMGDIITRVSGRQLTHDLRRPNMVRVGYLISPDYNLPVDILSPVGRRIGPIVPPRRHDRGKSGQSCCRRRSDPA